jgi:hypothetical protein
VEGLNIIDKDERKLKIAQLIGPDWMAKAEGLTERAIKLLEVECIMVVWERSSKFRRSDAFCLWRIVGMTGYSDY